MFSRKQSALALAIASSFAASAFAAQGPSSSATPYLLPSVPTWDTKSILTTGDSVNLKPAGGPFPGTPYRMAGIPDGLGAFDNGNGTFTVLMNHELGNTTGITRQHGSAGAFVSQWVIQKSDLKVLSGKDAIQNAYTWDQTLGAIGVAGYRSAANFASPSAFAAFGRFCSADLPQVLKDGSGTYQSAFYNTATGRGTRSLIYMNGEEIGAEGRPFATVITGANAGNAYELPYLGRFSWENSVANPFSQDKTIVMGTDDSTPGQVYMYVGTKTNTGTGDFADIVNAGLTNGKLFGIKLTGQPSELRATPPVLKGASVAFQAADLGFVQNKTGATLQTDSTAAGVTEFLRPEDGAWDPTNLNRFYFVTTDRYDQVKDGVGTQVGRSRLWSLTFSDLANPELGGNLELLLDGTEAGNMYDNITVDSQTGYVYLQEDVGNVAHLGKIFEYATDTKTLKEVVTHDQARFGNIGVPATGPFNVDEESSGIIDITDIMRTVPGDLNRYYLADVQAHYAISGELVEGGQLLLLTNYAPVPVPAAVWLMGSALLGLMGVARRKQA